MNDIYKSIGLFIGSIFFIFVYRRNNLHPAAAATAVVFDKRVKKTNPLENESKKFSLLYDPRKTTSPNQNITTELYKHETYEKMTEESEQEYVWKRRILLQDTPSGNIAMHYDLYRQAFAYHSDRYVSYPVLNLCAMKYVRLFFCRDFFVDTTFLPESFVNPFNQMKETEETRQKEKASAKRKELKIDFDSSAFIKKTKPNQKKVTYTDTPPVSTIYKNNFRHIGKISGDWNALQPKEIEKIELPNILDDYDHIHKTPKESAKTSYSLWKMVMKI